MAIDQALEPSFVELFTPKLITVLRERYRLADFRADLVSALTVAIVALPLSMAIAIASGVSPDRGLYTAIVGGFVVSALGGSRFQIGGPAGAFIVLVATTVQLHGVEGLLLATLLSGVILATLGLFRLGTYIKYIPYPVTVGFTAGIAVIIFASQLRDLLGLTLTAREPGALLPKLEALGGAFSTISVDATGLSALTIGTIVLVRRFRPGWPGLLIAVALAALTAKFAGLPVETIGTRFGGISHGLPAPHFPALSVAGTIAVLPSALSFALLGSIESLLSAVVADSMTGRRHRSNCELVAQGFANVASSIFGGICVTGTIARTATNVRSGARSPIAGMLHSLILLLFVLVAAPLASDIPLAALAGVLTTVAWNMAEKHAFGVLLRASRGDAVVLLATFLLTIFRDLTEGIVVGFSLSAFMFIDRMAKAIAVDSGQPIMEEDRADRDNPEGPLSYDSNVAAGRDIAIYRISGAFFFGAAASVAAALDRIAARPKAHIVDFSGVSVLDSTAAATIEGFVRKAAQTGAPVYVVGASPSVHRILTAHEISGPHVIFSATMAAAIVAAKFAVEQNMVATS